VGGCGLGLLLFLFACNGGERPNILFILADDQGSWTLGSQSYPNSHTPNLDKLASEGMLFPNAFSVGAVCSPSRAALISGRYPSETGVTGVVSTGSRTGIDTSLVLWPELLQGAGYKTVLVGKWHLGHAQEHHFPENNGYGIFSGFLHNGNRSRDPILRMEGTDTLFVGQYTSDVLTDLAMKYIRKFRKQPWVISLHYWAPHANTRFPDGFRPSAGGRSWLPMKEADLEYWKDLDLVLPDPDFPGLDTALLKRMMREYFASVHSIDRNLGRIMDLLEELSLDKNTVVVFSSDHGYMMGQHGLWHKGNGRWLTMDNKDPEGVYDGQRPNLFDNSIRVPLVVRWPGTALPGTVVDETVTFLDIYPTMLEIAGIGKPAGLLLRGTSMVPLLEGMQRDRQDTVFAQYASLRCIQTREWKYVHDFKDTLKNEIYHLLTDPKEYHNLNGSSDPEIREKREQLEEQLLRKLHEIDDPIIKRIQR